MVLENRHWNCTNIVDDARLVSSLLIWPSKARPRLSLLSSSKGRIENVWAIVWLGCTFKLGVFTSIITKDYITKQKVYRKLYNEAKPSGMIAQ